MAAVDKAIELNRLDEYWTLVQRTFLEIFQRPSSRPVERFRRHLGNRPQQEQLLAYHQEPLYVAAALAGAKVDEVVVRDYLRLVKQLQWNA